MKAEVSGSARVFRKAPNHAKWTRTTGRGGTLFDVYNVLFAAVGFAPGGARQANLPTLRPHSACSGSRRPHATTTPSTRGLASPSTLTPSTTSVPAAWALPRFRGEGLRPGRDRILPANVSPCSLACGSDVSPCPRTHSIGHFVPGLNHHHLHLHRHVLCLTHTMGPDTCVEPLERFSYLVKSP